MNIAKDEIERLNRLFRGLDCFYESNNLLNYFIQPHVMHLNLLCGGEMSSIDRKRHSHRTFECSMVISGSMIYKVADKESIINSGDAIIIPPDTRHRWIATEDSIIFSLMLFISCHGDGSRENMERLRTAIARSKFKIRKFIEMQNQISTLINEARKLQTGFDEKIQCLTREIYIEIFRKLLPEHHPEQRSLRMPPQRGDISASVVDLVRFYVQDNLSNKIKIQDISSCLGISINHLSRIFKKNYGIPIHNYIVMVRINTSEILLQTTDRPLKDIAASVGYEDVDYFCRIFKKYKGTTPSKFRQGITGK